MYVALPLWGEGRVRGGSSTRALGVLAELEAADLAAMHLVGTVGEAQGARVRPHEGERELLAHAAAAVQLHGAVDHARVMLGTATLISAMAWRAALLPTVSIM